MIKFITEKIFDTPNEKKPAFLILESALIASVITEEEAVISCLPMYFKKGNGKLDIYAEIESVLSKREAQFFNLPVTKLRGQVITESTLRLSTGNPTLFYNETGSLSNKTQTYLLYLNGSSKAVLGAQVDNMSIDEVEALIASTASTIQLALTSADFTDDEYVNTALIGKTPDIDFSLSSDEGSGSLLYEGDGYDFTSGTGTIWAPAGKYRLIIY